MVPDRVAILKAMLDPNYLHPVQRLDIKTGKILKGYRPLEPAEIVMIIRELENLDPTRIKDSPAVGWKKYRSL